MASVQTPTDQAFLRLVQKTLEDELKATLKGPLMVIAEREIDAAVLAAVTALSPRVEAEVDRLQQDLRVNFLINGIDLDGLPTGRTDKAEGYGRDRT